LSIISFSLLLSQFGKMLFILNLWNTTLHSYLKKEQNFFLYNTLAVHRLYVVLFKCWGGDKVKKKMLQKKIFKKLGPETST